MTAEVLVHPHRSSQPDAQFLRRSQRRFRPFGNL